MVNIKGAVSGSKDNPVEKYFMLNLIIAITIDFIVPTLTRSIFV